MLDTIRIGQEIHLEPGKLIDEYYWDFHENWNHNSFYPYILTRRIKEYGLYFAYFFYSDFAYGILSIRFSSLPKFLHGSNVNYLTSDDLSQLDKKFNRVLDYVGIDKRVSLNTLLIRYADIAFNLMFENDAEAREVLIAIMSMPHWNASYPKIVMKHGVYFRHSSRSKPEKPTTGNTGLLIYHKQDKVDGNEYLNNKGVLRFEIRIPRSQGLKRYVGENITIPEFYTKKDEIKKLFAVNLKRAYIYPGCKMVSYDKAERMIASDSPKYTWVNRRLQQFWDLTKLKKDAFILGPNQKKKYNANRFRDVVLRDRLNILFSFLRGNTDKGFALFDMLMQEIDLAFTGKSKFRKVSKINNQTPIVKPLQLPDYSTDYVIERWNNDGIIGSIIDLLQLDCNTVFGSL